MSNSKPRDEEIENRVIVGTRSYWGGNAEEFLATKPEIIVAELAQRVSREHTGNEVSQLVAWDAEIKILRDALTTLGTSALDWGLLLELPLWRLRRRMDAVILIGHTIVVVEFKIGADSFVGSDIEQVEDYALCLRDFHGLCNDKCIVPILCAEFAECGMLQEPQTIDGVSQTLQTNADSLVEALRIVARAGKRVPGQLDWLQFDRGRYSPTPTIIESACAVYGGHSVEEIGRKDAEGESIARTLGRLRELAYESYESGTRTICFVTGTPGAGKTLLGLDLVLARSVGEENRSRLQAVMLSSNRPLVRVLQRALAENSSGKYGMKEATRLAETSIQELLGFLREHGEVDDFNPPEQVIVYDEAQRAWSREKREKKIKRPAKSEPATLLEILSRSPSVCLVCLIGPGQEINEGEGGLALWGEALASAWEHNEKWSIYASPVALGHESGLVGEALFSDATEASANVIEDRDLHLSAAIRSYRNRDHVRWVEALLNGKTERAAAIAKSMKLPPSLATRSLKTMKRWLLMRRRGGRRVGLLASSAAVRLRAEGVLPAHTSSDLDAVCHWFLRDSSDYRSSNVLEVPLSEFVCQGLEIDYVGFCWGGDLIWEAGEWIARKTRAPNWSRLRKERDRAYRVNAYRVLLTRAREGMVVYVPEGSSDDPTRSPKEFDDVYGVLLACGCLPITLNDEIEY